MSPKAMKLLDDALRLTPREQADLAASLISRLESDNDEDGAAWDAMIARRVREIDEGRVKLVPWSKIRKRVRASLDESADG